MARSVSTCLSTTTTELRKLGVVSTPEGQAALALARAIDSGRSLMALPAMVDRLHAVMQGLRDRRVRAGDTVDDLRTRREAKIASAG